MMLIFGLMLLLQTAACVERNCRFNQSDPCNTALGDKLYLLMVQDAGKYNLTIKKRINNTQDGPVCRIKKNIIKQKECDLYNNRPEVTVNNGTLIINYVIRADAGNYTLKLVSSDGIESSKYLQVNVEAPSVTLIILGCFAVILIVLAAIAYYIYKKKNRLKPTPNVESATTDPHTNKNVKKEQDLHYGEVTFANRNVQQRPSKTQEDCVYAQVQAH
ncbi:hypothetical protein ROHU_026545 [Labeo rohita]|uniref:Uncharacterized protein n=1 Tax=Labeo rohita TaxID=84645 RepID=A0A498MC85_LABRO|nr:hypothetical protein ROHU_026545 [Labeo rohita]